MSDPEKITLSIEHGWVCIRAANQHLIWGEKISDIPHNGVEIPFTAWAGREPWRDSHLTEAQQLISQEKQ